MEDLGATGCLGWLTFTDRRSWRNCPSGPRIIQANWTQVRIMPSSSSTLAAKSQGNIHSSRPSSRNTSRPPSSAIQRPSSSLSTRPVSSASTRPQSRFSHRPHSRHARSRLIPICQTLVSQITGIDRFRVGDDAEDDEFGELVEYAVKNLESSTINKAAASVDLSVIDRQINGYVAPSAS